MKTDFRDVHAGQEFKIPFLKNGLGNNVLVKID